MSERDKRWMAYGGLVAAGALFCLGLAVLL